MAELKQDEVSGAAEAFLDFLNMETRSLGRISGIMHDRFGAHSVSYQLSALALNLKHEIEYALDRVNRMEGPGEAHLSNLNAYGITTPADHEAAAALGLLSEEPNLDPLPPGAAAFPAPPVLIDLTADDHNVFCECDDCDKDADSQMP